jgi:uncharacterized protein YndB with AHSA1/START domain
MKKVLKVIGAVIVLAIVGVLIFASTKPNTFTVKRSAIINAPADKIYPLIVDFHKWAAWSPYESLDPTMKKTFSGPESGVGSVYAWSGNDKAGAGNMQITQATSPTDIKIDLTFTKPFQSKSVTEFSLQKLGPSTVVTWQMSGPNPFMSKVMQTFCDMDKMLGTDFEKGLHNLTALSESPAKKK